MTVTPEAAVHLVRTDKGRYLAMNRNGVEIELGRGDDLFSPVELLLAALAGCTAIDVDFATSRHAEPDVFNVGAAAVRSDEGGNHLEDVHVTLSLRYPQTSGGDRATAMLERVIKLSHEKLCTVARTVEAGTPVEVRVKYGQPFQAVPKVS